MLRKKHNKQEIINGILTFSKEIYSFLDDKFREKIIQHVCNNSGIREEGEELYQDVIFEIYLNIEQGKYYAEGPGTFNGYIMTITRSRWIDRLRAKRNKLRLTNLEEVDHKILFKEDYELQQADARNNQILAIRKHLERLPKEDQEYIQLYYFTKQSLQTIADNFGTSYDYARLKLHRTREKLRRMVENDPEFKTKYT